MTRHGTRGGPGQCIHSRARTGRWTIEAPEEKRRNDFGVAGDFASYAYHATTSKDEALRLLADMLEGLARLVAGEPVGRLALAPLVGVGIVRIEPAQAEPAQAEPVDRETEMRALIASPDAVMFEPSAPFDREAELEADIDQLLADHR